MERIYIGGMDPDRLTVDQVLARIPSQTVHIHQVSHPPRIHHHRPRYCHISATIITGKTKNDSSNDDDDVSSTCALQIIQKQLHNVKWKGCRIQVLAAKPHFLERLRAERRQRLQQQQQTQADTATIQNVSTDETTTTKTASSLSSPPAPSATLPKRLGGRRYFRIRRAYGKPAWLVDTKPYQVSNDASFQKMVQHVTKRRQVGHIQTTAVAAASNKKNNNKNSKAAAPKPFRAVHWKWQDESNNDALMLLSADDEPLPRRPRKSVPAHDNRDDDNDDDSSLVSSSTPSSSSSSDESSSSSLDDGADKSNAGNAQATKKKGTYVWSDDDASTNSSSSSTAAANQPDKTKPNAELASQGGTYDWSDDDDDDQDESSSSDHDRRHQRSTVVISLPLDHSSGLDEFAAALEPSHDDKYHGKGSAYNNVPSTEHVEVNLEQDEERNLKILADLFPEMGVNTSATASKETNANTTSQQGWNASGLMMRYDPTKDSSKKLLEAAPQDDQGEHSHSESLPPRTNVDDQNTHAENLIQCKHDKASTSSSCASSKSSQASEKANNDATRSEAHKEKPVQLSDPMTNIYRQDDLENVFREARESQENRAPVVVERNRTSATEAAAASAGGFSFGFALQQTEAPPVRETTSFSFGFDLPKEAAGTEAAAQQHLFNTKDELSDDSMKKETSRKRRKVASSYHDLDGHVNAFLFELNEGQRIAQDLTGFRNDPKMQKDWETQRARLTNDWKAKRKHAVARKQKRHG